MPKIRHSLVGITNDAREAAAPRPQGHTTYYLSPEELSVVNAKYPRPARKESSPEYWIDNKTGSRRSTRGF